MINGYIISVSYTHLPENVEKWFGDREKMLQILRLYMGVGAKRRRKDLMYAKQIFELISYFFDGESAEDVYKRQR